MGHVIRTASLATLLLAGCATYGDKVDHDQLVRFQPGTPCTEIVQPKPYGLGKPTTDKRSSDGTRQLTYVYGHSEADAGAIALAVLGIPAGRTTTEQTNVVVDCDQGGRLVSYSSTTGQMGYGVGVTGGQKQ